MKKKLFNLILSSLYPVADFIAVTLAILFSYNIYRLLGIGKQVYYEKTNIIALSLITALATVIIMLILRAYKKVSSILNVEEIKNAIKGVTFTFILFAVVAIFVKWAPSRYILIFSYIFSLLLVVIEKSALYHILPLSTLLRSFHKRIFIYGAGELGQALYRSIINSPKLGIIPVGFIDDKPDKQDMIYYQSGFNCSNGISVLGTRKSIGRLKKEFQIDEVYVAISNINHPNLINILGYLKSENIKVSFVPNLYKVFVHKVKIDKIGQIPLVKEVDDFKNLYLGIKRYTDLLFAIILLCLLWPLFSGTAIDR